MRVAVGLSGGVDSAVTALLLKEQGYEVTGVYLHCWNDKSNPGCKADEDNKSALNVALELDIPFKVLDFSEEYKGKVIEYFYREYEKGRTPNPDVMCNSEIKFGMFLDWAVDEGFDYVATGHYARLDSGQARMTKLMIPKDKHKDQTYFLWKLGQKELKRVLFPLGDYLKSEVRDLAKKAGLSVADRPDSQGICFVGKVDVKDFLKKRLDIKRGDVVDIKGDKIGEHDGAWFYTIGQRGGWKMTTKFKNPIQPLYVIKKDVKENLLVVGENKDAERKSFEVGELSWVGKNCTSEVRFLRIRHGGELIPVTIHGFNPHGGLNPCLEVKMGAGQRGVAAGQSAVFYSNDGECLGGGVIV